jgi:hypothetical protein
MIFGLTPMSTGRVEIPPLKVTISGKECLTNPVSFTVIEPGKTDKMKLELELSDEKCYVGQPVLLKVKWYLYGDIGNYTLTVPVLQTDEFDVEEADAGEQPAGRQIQIAVNGQTVIGTQRPVVREGQTGALVSFVKLLVPKKPGNLLIQPASAAADFVVGTVRSRDPFDIFGPQPKYQKFVVSSEEKKLTVMPLPTEGRPKDFYGLVGKYTIAAEARPTSVTVGEPITLTVRVNGRLLKAVQAPDLAGLPGFAESFRMPREQAAPRLTEQGKEFTQTIRATSENVKAIPSIPLVYFDAEKGRYVTVETDPIPLTVEKTTVLTSTDVEGIRDAAVSARAVEAAKIGISANYNGADALENQGFSLAEAMAKPTYAAIWGVPLVALGASLVVKAAGSTSPEREARRRRRNALRKAVAMLRKASDNQKHEVAAEAMKLYIGDRFDRVAGSLTAEECRAIVAAATADEELATRYKSVVERCEAGRYAGGGMDQLPLDADIIELMKRVERRAKR